MAEDVRARVRALVREAGASAAARILGMPRSTVLSIASDSPETREGSLALAKQRLDQMEARGT